MVLIAEVQKVQWVPLLYLTSERRKAARPAAACLRISQYLRPLLARTTRPLLRRSHSPRRLVEMLPFLSPAISRRNSLCGLELKPAGATTSSRRYRRSCSPPRSCSRSATGRCTDEARQARGPQLGSYR